MILYIVVYIVEIFCGVIYLVLVGEVEVVCVFGMLWCQVFWYIILLCVVCIGLLVYSNEVILMFKVSVVVYIVILFDIMGMVWIIIVCIYELMLFFCLVGVLYLVIIIVLMWIFCLIECWLWVDVIQGC